jgi:predicted O-methyltransferase YrrM
VTDTLASPKVVGLLNRLLDAADAGDPELLARIQREADERFGGQRYAPELSPLFDQAYLPVPPEVGRFLYVLTRAKRPKFIVEVGTSFGVSAIHFACALKDNGEGQLISAELSRAKSEAAANNLASLGLGNLVEIRCGDASETLGTFSGKIDLLFLDGWKDGYLPLLKMLEGAIAPGGLVVADDIRLFPERLASYLAYVREPLNNYHSVELPIGDGVELSVRT